MGKLVGKIWVGGTTCLIAFIAYSSQIFVLWPWYGRAFSVEFLTVVGPFNVLVGLLFWNYYATVTTNPGHVPLGWRPDIQDDVEYQVKKVTHTPRYCRTCKQYKPPRAHHCRQCDKCVLRMDHHCPWVNNCVGHYNYAHFIRFLLLVDIATTYHIVMMCFRTADAMNGLGRSSEASALEITFLLLNWITGAPVLCCVGLFSLYHFYCVATNTTTIESWEKDKVATLIRKGRIREVKYPYHLGTLRNLRYIVGITPSAFFLPATQVTGDGLSYPVAEGTDPDVGTFWPPKDPMRDTSYNPHMPTNANRNQDEFRLPDSPWTFGGDGFNPGLAPSSATRRRKVQRADYQSDTRPNGATASIAAQVGHISAYPPYHPSYTSGTMENRKERGFASSRSSSSPERNDSDDSGGFGPSITRPDASRDVRMRRGSEGWEARPQLATGVDRWDVNGWRGDIPSADPTDKYRRYIPEPDSESEDQEGEQVDDWEK